MTTTTRPALDIARLRADFPILETSVHGRPLVYLDNAATSQKPRAVIEAVRRYYSSQNANIHRGVYALSEQATAAYEGAREKAARFVNARTAREIVFVRGTTEGVNLVASSWGRSNLGPGDEVLVSGMEHHSNIVPWQMACEATGASLRVIPINQRGELVLEEYERLLRGRVKLVAVAHASNSLGTVNPVAEMTRLAHACGAVVLVDGAQGAPHLPIDVQQLGADFYTVSGHKMYGPTGIGVLFGRLDLFETMPPYQGGGDMIRTVTFARSTYAEPPARFEAGTPHIAGGIALGAAIDYLGALDGAAVAAHEQDLLDYATTTLGECPGVRLIGTAARKIGVLSFLVEGVHAHDVGTILDQEGVAVRTGHHCAQPVMDFFGVPATVRASFACYNTRDEVDRLVAAVNTVRRVFA